MSGIERREGGVSQEWKNVSLFVVERFSLLIQIKSIILFYELFFSFYSFLVYI